MEVTDEELVAAYVALRDEKAAIEKRLKTEVEPIAAKLDRLSRELGRRLEERKATGLKTSEGTVSVVVTQEVGCGDWDLLLSWVRDNDRMDLLGRKVLIGPIKSMLEAGEGLPPGVYMSSAASVRVRRA
jgi:hypothetical protein